MDQTQQKQEFLKTNIMEAGYDAQEFVNFLSSKKENGDDINEWNLQELKLAVRLFTAAQDQQNSQGNEPEQQQQVENQEQDQQQQNSDAYQQQQSDQYNQQQEQQQQQQQEEQVTEQGNNNDNEEQKQEQEQVAVQQEQQQQQQQQQEKQQTNESVVPQQRSQSQYQPNQQQMGAYDVYRQVGCQKVQKSDFYNAKDITINLDDYEKINGGIFSSSYIVYKIKTFPFNWEVDRRYSDFLTLRNILTKQFPATVIPTMPRKTNTRNYSPMFIKKRISVLEKFLQKCIKNPVLKASKYVEGFLSMKNEKDLKNLFKEGEKIPQGLKMEKIPSVDGYLDSQLSQQINNFCNKSTEYFTHSDPIYKKIRQLSKQLFMDYDQLSSTLFNIGDCFSQLYNCSEAFNAGVKEENDQNKLLDDIYVTMNNMSVQWGNAISTQLKMIQENFTFFFKYYNAEGRQVKENLKQRDEINKKYLDHKKKLNDKKEKLFSMQQFNQWEMSSASMQKYTHEDLKKDKQLAFSVMLPKDTMVEQELREKSGYYSKSLVDDIKRILNEKVTEYSEHFVKFGHLQTDNIQELHVLWADCMTNLETLGKGGHKLSMLQKQRVQEEQDNNQYD